MFKKFTAICLMLGVFAENAQALLVDLNDFYADPSVSISADGTTALLTEDELSSSVLLSNHPGLGDPELIVPREGSYLFLDYAFTEGEDNDDELRITLFDANVFELIGTTFAFGNEAGQHQFIYALDTLIGRTVGIQFELRSFDTLLGSTAKISNLRIIDIDDFPTPAPVPVPASAYLMLSATLALYVIRRLRRHPD